MDAIIRQSYLDKIEKFLGKDFIIILTGQRRVGKSYILRMFKDKVQTDEQANIIFIDKEKNDFDSIKNYQDLDAHINKRYKENKINYILVDEIQDIKDFEKTLRSYYEIPNIEIIITGSNSMMLSSDLSNRIGGRYKEIFVQALSYEEFKFGGLPGLLKIGLDEQDAREYQKDVYNTVLLKDVIMRNSIRNVPFLENLVRFLADNTGKIFSANSISKYMVSQGQSITSSAIINYIKSLCDAYIIHKVNRYDIHGKKLFESNDKYYFEDNGIRNAIVGGTREGDIEKVIENIVYNHLIRLGYEVNVGQLRDREIDFIAQKPLGHKVYVQVSYIIADEATRKREFGNLRDIKDNYPKYVISTTPLLTQNDENGITHLHLRKFLTQGL